MRNLLLLTTALLLLSCGKDDDLPEGCQNCTTELWTNIIEIQKRCDGLDYDSSIFTLMSEESKVYCDWEIGLLVGANGNIYFSEEELCEGVRYRKRIESTCD